jgi:hypothetical protein
VSDSVVRLIERVACPTGGNVGTAEWLRGYADGIEAGVYGEIDTVVLLCERKDGRMGKASQSVNRLDTARLVGLMTIGVLRCAEGDCDIERLKEA